MDSIVDMIRITSTTSEEGILATTPHIDGSAYQGDMMLFGKDGLQMGMISGG